MQNLQANLEHNTSILTGESSCLSGNCGCKSVIASDTNNTLDSTQTASCNSSGDATNAKDVARWQLQAIMDLFSLPFNDLLFKAHKIHRDNFEPNEVQLSTLLSIKTGGCPEDCAYCPQAARYNTGINAEKLLPVDYIKEKAQQAKDAGATRFCMGAAWREVKDRDVPKLAEIISSVKDLGLETCMTLGMLQEKQAHALKDAGLDYYNHNLDTSAEFYGNIISTRTYQERLDTLDNVVKAGMNSCSGGILGMGESVEDRAKMLQTLANRAVPPKSVPINKLVKVANTPLDDKLSKHDEIDSIDFIKTIAVARIVLPHSYVRLSAGREEMSDEMQAMCFFAGANSIFYGEKLLTTDNPESNKDRELFAKLGIKTC